MFSRGLWGGGGLYGLWLLSGQMSPANGACKACVPLIAPNDCMTERFGHDISPAIPGIRLADAPALVP